MFISMQINEQNGGMAEGDSEGGVAKRLKNWPFVKERTTEWARQFISE